ncbi:MAG: signal peptidase II [Acetatifactor sp.]|nr:signal peptidase II [Acetatifactor sp.]
MINFFVSLIVGIFMGDSYLKERMERQLPPGEDQEAWGGRLLLRKHHNPGVMLGVGKKQGRLVTILSLLFTAFAALIFVCSLSIYGSNLLRTGLSLLLGGAFSNTYDRLKQQYVTDYVSFNVKWKPLRRLVFNVSDFCIILGAMLSALGLKHQGWKLRKLAEKRKKRRGAAKSARESRKNQKA